MPKRKSKFIDKRGAVTWHLFDRAQDDIMCGDAAMPQVAMVEVEQRQRRLRERRKFGIYYEDDYDYMQHLRPRTGAPIVLQQGDSDDGEGEAEGEGSDAFDGELEEEVASAAAAASAASAAATAAASGGFALPVELLPNNAEVTADAGDDDFFDPEIAEAIAAAEEADAEDAAVAERGDIEDDFVALASAPDPADGGCRPPLFGPGSSKRDIFSRFFDEDPDDDGDDENARTEEPAAAAASVTTSRRGRPLTYHEEVIEDQFDRLLLEFHRDSVDPDAAAADGDPGAVDDDAGSAMTKSLWQTLERHERELESEAVTLRDLDAGRLPAADTLRALASLGYAGEGEGEEEEDSDGSADTDEELSRWGPMAERPAPRLVPIPNVEAACGRPRNLPVLLDTRPRRPGQQRDSGDNEEDSDSDSDSADTDDTAKAAAAPPSQTGAGDALPADRKERKRLVKQQQRARRQEKKLSRQRFGRARAELQSAVTGDPYQRGRVLKLC